MNERTQMDWDSFDKIDWENIIDWNTVANLTDSEVDAILDMFDK